MCTLEDIERSLRSHPVSQTNGHHQSGIPDNSHDPLHIFPPPPPPQSGGPLNAPSRLPPGFVLPPQPQGFPGPGPGFGPPPFPPLNRSGPPPQQGFPPMMGPPPPRPHSPNQYNKRLVMEIQQTHPLLFGYHRMNHPMHPMFLQQQQQQGQGHMAPHHGHGMPPHPMMNGGGGPVKGMHAQRGYSPMGGGARDGNVSLTRQLHGDEEEAQNARDEYRNLMTQRDKQWLIGIQLLQLNTVTPYIDDYYYTVYRERRSQGRRENRFHTDNQLNHPLTQPQGHAQLVLQSIGNRNQKQGVFANSRDRKSSESRGGGGGANNGGSDKAQEQAPRTYTPLQFENSLGKLQCSSVTAPRKIIEMEIMAAEAGAGGAGGGSLEVTAQRKCRQLLLHIETLYRVVLKLEDLKNPTAIEAFALLREKKERERKALLEAAEREAAAAALSSSATPTTTAVPALTTGKATTGGGRLNIESSALSEDKSKLGEETAEELLRVLVQGLAPEKVFSMMLVRKGRTLLQRAMAQLEVDVWPAWVGVVLAVPVALKKDREETEAQLVAFCAELKRHAARASLRQLHVLGQGIEQKAAALFSTKVRIRLDGATNEREIISLFSLHIPARRCSDASADEPGGGSVCERQGDDQHGGAERVERAAEAALRSCRGGHGGQGAAAADADAGDEEAVAAGEGDFAPNALPRPERLPGAAEAALAPRAGRVVRSAGTGR